LQTGLASQHSVLRCTVEDADGRNPRSVVLKQVTATQFTSGGEGPSHRFLNELSGLQLLNTGPDRGSWPGLIASSVEDELLILEDVGSGPTVQEILLGNDPILAEAALRDMATALGDAHSAAHGRVEEFQRLRRGLGAGTVLSDATRDLRHDLGLFRESFDHFGVRAHPAFFSELDDLESSLHSPDVLQTVIHADAGPQNFIHTNRGAVLIDFEFMAPGNPLLDLVSARLGFPHSEDGRRIPAWLVEAVEEHYRAAVGVSMPEMGDDDLFGRVLVDACAHWALGRWARLWNRLFRDPHDFTPTTNGKRSQALSVYDGFTTLEDVRGFRTVLTETLSSCVAAVRKHFPTLEPSPLYDCFAETGSNV